MFSDYAEESNLCSFLEDEVDEICDTECELNDSYADVEREMCSTDEFIEDELDELITQKDVRIIQDELKDEYEAELLTDAEIDKIGTPDYARGDDLINPFANDGKPMTTIKDFLNDY